MGITSNNSNDDEFCGKSVRHFIYIIGAAAVMILIGTYYYKYYYSQGNGVVPVSMQNTVQENIRIQQNQANLAAQNKINVNQQANTLTMRTQQTSPTARFAPTNPTVNRATTVQNQTSVSPLPVVWSNNNTMNVAQVVKDKILPNFSAVVEVMHPSVVNINTTRQTGGVSAPTNPTNNHQVKFSSPLTGSSVNSIGSGFIVSTSGYVLTNYHVIKDATGIFITVFARDGSTNRYQAEVIKLDETKDLALVKMNSNKVFTPVVLGDSTQLKVADSVLAIGSPYGLAQTVSRGIVSGIRKSLSIENVVHKNLIQTDAAINQGNSGGPLVDRYAHVIGINTAIYTPTGAFSGIGFAIPSNILKLFIEKEIQPNSTWNVLSKGLLGGLGMSVAAPNGVPPTINANSTPPGSHADGRNKMVCSTCHQVAGVTGVAFNPNGVNNLGRNVAQGPPISANAGIPGNHKRDGRDKNCAQCHQINGTGKWNPVAFSNQWTSGGMLTVAANAGPPINANSRPPGSHKRDGRDKMQCKMCHQINGGGNQMMNPIAFATNGNQFATPGNTFIGQNIAATITQDSAKVTTMGMELQPLNQAIISSLNNPLTEGVFVASIMPNTSASRAGIKAGDIIFKLDGRWISSPAQLKRRLATYMNNDNVRLGIYRDGQRVNRYLVITQSIAQQQVGTATLEQQAQVNGLPTETNWNGMELKPITPLLLAKEPQLTGMLGAMINDVDKQSTAEAVGLQKGDVIVSINNQPVNTPDRMFKIIGTTGTKPILIKLVRNGREFFVTLT